MHFVRLSLAITLGLVMTLFLVTASVATAYANSAIASSSNDVTAPHTTIQETALTPGGAVGEINADDESNLWVSDYTANIISKFNASGTMVTNYSGLSGGIVEAQAGPNNTIWFNGYDNATIGRIALGSSIVTSWTIPGSVHPWGLAIDDAQNIWIAEHDVSTLYRFTPLSRQLCTYALPNESKSVYLHATADGIWLGDYINNAMIRLDTDTGTLMQWPIQPNGNANPYGMTTDAAGNLWWADGGMGAVAKLEPATNRITAYRSNQISSPNFVDVDGDNVWFVDTFFNQFGVFNAAQISGGSYEVTPTTVSLGAPSCVNLGIGNSSTATVETKEINVFVETEAPDATKNDCNWVSQKSPEGGTLYDIAIVNNRVWITDYGRQQLITTPDIYSARLNEACSNAYLPYLDRE